MQEHHRERQPENEKNILEGNVKGKLIVDGSTVHPNTTAMSAKAIEVASSAMAKGGQLVCVLAGPKEDVEKVVSYYKGVMGRANIDFGSHPRRQLC